MQVLWLIKSMVFKEMVKNYNWLMLIVSELCIIVQLLHIMTTRFWFDIEEKERKKPKEHGLYMALVLNFVHGYCVSINCTTAVYAP